jgi:hypothetical protein
VGQHRSNRHSRVDPCSRLVLAGLVLWRRLLFLELVSNSYFLSMHRNAKLLHFHDKMSLKITNGWYNWNFAQLNVLSDEIMMPV